VSGSDLRLICENAHELFCRVCAEAVHKYVNEVKAGASIGHIVEKFRQISADAWSLTMIRQAIFDLYRDRRVELLWGNLPGEILVCPVTPEGVKQ